MNDEAENCRVPNSENIPMAKPLKSIETLIQYFRNESTPLLLRDSESEFKLHNSQGELQVILVLEGLVDVYRNSDQLLFATASAPTIFGMQGSPYRYNMYKFVCHPGCILESLSLSAVVKIIMEHQLLEELLTCQTYFNDYHAYRTNMLINKSAYEIVRAFLLELEREPAEIRANINVPAFILARSNLARSGVMKILAELRQGEYIKIENGKLISILRVLPKAF
ncbi:helix-turn-helix domain-containing protein [Rahnella woolbedingensis]|uniref:IprA winged helix-turn-helix domain-containing protein n=1 Tax=Rahnella woolbedingensis TaxID=1510574 RepID=A0A419N3E6_9GAMM|nr:helix-turn-helix domain-containing protein [Rahnella woolbedingensis]RJT37416.1 hypothetical protein D6C13_21930 [Rahnella woolbedingensis]